MFICRRMKKVIRPYSTTSFRYSSQQVTLPVAFSSCDTICLNVAISIFKQTDTIAQKTKYHIYLIYDQAKRGWELKRCYVKELEAQGLKPNS